MGSLRRWVFVLVVCGVVGQGAPASAQDLNGVGGYVSPASRWFTDEQGRTMAFRGFVLPYKRPPYLVTAAGFSEDDADFLAREGFNLLQLRFTYGAIEPQPGQYDEAYVAQVVRTVRMLTSRGIRVMLQANQGNYGPKTHGQGFPEWATFTDGMPNPALGFGPNFLANPALLRAWDNLWADRRTARGEGIQAGFAKGLAKVVAPLADDPLVLGIDLLNEPWLGSRYPTCFPIGREVPAGCPLFDNQVLKPFYERVIAALRPLMPRQTILYEPVPTFDLGVPTHLRGVGGDDPRMAFTFHAYCSIDGGGADLPSAPPSDAKERQCDKEEDRILANAIRHGEAEDVPVLSSEFGATPLAVSTKRLMEDHDRRLLSWTYAAYCCRARGEVPSGDVILDPRKPPTAANLNHDKLVHLVRPYGAALTGTAERTSFDPASGRFELAYRTARPGGGSYPADLESVVHVPARQYPDGYDVAVRGATVTSAPGAVRLGLRTDPGAERVELTVTRPGPRAYVCASRRVVRVTLPTPPRGARAVRARVTLDGRPLRVRRDGRRRSATVDLRGRPKGRATVRAITSWRTTAGTQVRRERRSTFATCTARR